MKNLCQRSKQINSMKNFIFRSSQRSKQTNFLEKKLLNLNRTIVLIFGFFQKNKESPFGADFGIFRCFRASFTNSPGSSNWSFLIPKMLAFDIMPSIAHPRVCERHTVHRSAFFSIVPAIFESPVRLISFFSQFDRSPYS